MADEVRTALIEVVPLPGNEHAFDGCPGAYTNFYALAISDQDFRTIASLAMESLRLRVGEVEDVLVVDVEEQTQRIQDLLSGLSDEVPWAHDTFHAYEDIE